MKTLSINKQSIKEAINILKFGGTVVFPTETAYGLAVDATNNQAIKQIFKIKQRSPEKSLPWIVSSISMAKKYVKFSALAKKLAKKYWPGPLTMVLPVKRGKKTLALRVSSNKIARALSFGLGRPIISTSANISNQATCYSASAVKKQFVQKILQPDLLLDSGKLKKNKLSTIIKITKEKIIILRQGNLKIKIPR